MERYNEAIFWIEVLKVRKSVTFSEKRELSEKVGRKMKLQSLFQDISFNGQKIAKKAAFRQKSDI